MADFSMQSRRQKRQPEGVIMDNDCPMCGMPIASCMCKDVNPNNGLEWDLYYRDWSDVETNTHKTQK